ncbi:MULTISPECIES: histidine phosphatase family protein [Aerococcus]|uniref:histidine phosphatase family protein n=1 Tax=Aerococcus TaxID=1375 RepID=UPI000DCD3B03|nr:MULTISPECIES: histidine phosphatase family protein [Aerococcus]KAA9297505.1 histidine phosphatase family protein [Aerococcus tenax]MDK8132711.1 histidine phosphatase family protein [Aerococcus urinae]MDK8484368.1 histidine phosphatase family protein [Aerococcus urinae]MDL5179349.1 histidine phosphatase family protein [Aerococcus tenax]MDL5208250.1 histidine phosphatase family protein [Aerococcus tenax]
MVKKLYLMRHGQTLFNQLNRIQGACDSPLTDLGREQAQKVYDYFQEEGIDFQAVYSSTQERACDTTEIVVPQTNYIRKKGLKEWNFGLYEGASEYLNPPHKEGEESYGDYFLDYGGESVDQVAERMTETITEVMDTAGQEEKVLCVSHGGAMYAFYLKWRKQTDQRPHFSNCCILEYSYDEDSEDFSLIKSINVV